MPIKAIEKIESSNFPFDWIDTGCYPESDGNRVEIYLKEDSDFVNHLILMFYDLFGEIKDEIFIYDNSWWNFTLDTFDVNSEKCNYSIEDKSEQSKRYLKMLQSSNISIDYLGSCRCLNWDNFLFTVIDCIVSHIAPYSQLFYSEKYNFFFYFHHTGSIGLYYKEPNDQIKKILNTGQKEYVITS